MTEGSLRYIRGDATRPVGDGPRLLLHVVNDIGRWGAGFVLALSRRWSLSEEAYYSLDKHGQGFPLGLAQVVKVEENLWVVNMIGQHGVGIKGKKTPPIRYEAIREALQSVVQTAKDPALRGPYKACSIHCPKFGAGLAGGDWGVIEEIIKDELVSEGLNVTVYEFDLQDGLLTQG